ncbi:transposase [Clostridium culturomicium]|uniref:transposase n=1 Tax=Clostridium culturomicium TaxID=1499683 RepID=UPI0009DD6F45
MFVWKVKGNVERAYLRDIKFMWLLEGEEVLSYSTISRFRTERLRNRLEDLFS